MLKNAFTDLAVKSLSPGTHFDAKLPGFGMRVGKHRRTWLVVKGPAKKRQFVTLGHYPAISLSDARKLAHVALGTPVVDRTAPAFTEAKEAFLSQKGKWRRRTFLVMKSNLRHFTWTKPVDKITHEEVIAVLDGINLPSAKFHAFKDIRALFAWCIPRYIKYSPCVGIKMPPQPTRDRVLTDDEIKAIWKACESLGQFGAIVKLLLLTGQRRNEIASLRPEWIDGTTVTLPAEIVKNKRLHTFPASKTALELVPLAIGSRKFSNWERMKEKLDEVSGVSAWTLHDLRRTFATRMGSIKVDIHVTEKILNHVSGTLSGVAGTYNRFLYWDQQVAAAQAWEKELMSIVRI